MFGSRRSREGNRIDRGQLVFQPAHHMRQAIAERVRWAFHPRHAGHFIWEMVVITVPSVWIGVESISLSPHSLDVRQARRKAGGLCIRPILVGVQQILGDQTAFPTPHIAVPVGWNLQRR